MKNKSYGKYGGVYLPEILMSPILELQAAWENIKNDKIFQETLTHILKTYAGRPTPLTEVKRFAKAIDGPHIYLKREDLLHTGAHKLNNALGQCLLAKHMGKKRIIAETGAGQHGVATAAAAAFLDLECTVYMGFDDIKRQAPNVRRMKLLGANVEVVQSGSRTLKDAINEALRDWSHTLENSYYCLGSALGPEPYPEMVAHFQSVIGLECEAQFQKYNERDPDLIIACVGGGSNAIGIFSPFLQKSSVQLVGVEAEGAARFNAKTTGVLHGCFTYVLQDETGQIAKTHSISAGLDYPSVSPIHADLYEKNRVTYVTANDEESVLALKLLARTEGIIAALESAHALAYLKKIAPTLDKHMHVIVNLSGRGDKDLESL